MTFATRFIHRWIERRYHIDTSTILNNHSKPEERTGSISEQFYAIFQQMQALAFPDENGRVDYVTLRECSILTAYREATRRLPLLTPEDLPTREERLAFWINLYNGLVLDAVLAWGVQESVQEVPGFFWKAGYQIGGCRFNAYDIEYGVLRANAGHPAIPGPQIQEGDERLAFCLDEIDPRTQFALVRAARSCPGLRVYSPEHIDEQLDEAARRFINGRGVQMELDRNTVWLSEIFQWYAPDFEAAGNGADAPGSVQEFVARYRLEPGEVRYLTTQKPKIKYLDHDWSLNG